MDAKGNAMAVWLRKSGDTVSVWASHYTTSDDWGAPERISTLDVTDASDLDVVMDPQGRATALWRQKAGEQSNFALWARRFE